jgi:hypothetical protein
MLLSYDPTSFVPVNFRKLNFDPPPSQKVGHPFLKKDRCCADSTVFVTPANVLFIATVASTNHPSPPATLFYCTVLFINSQKTLCHGLHHRIHVHFTPTGFNTCQIKPCVSTTTTIEIKFMYSETNPKINLRFALFTHVKWLLVS